MKESWSSYFKQLTNKVFPNQESLSLCIGTVVLVLGLYYFFDVLLPVLISIIIVFVLYEPAQMFQRIGIPKFVVLFSFLLALFGITIVFFAFVIPLFWQESIGLLGLLPELNINARNLLQEYLTELPFVSADTIENFVSVVVSQMTASIQKILSFSFSSLLFVIWAVLYCLLVPVLVFFFLYDGDMIRDRIQSRVFNHNPLLQTIWQQTSVNLMLYVRGKVIEIIVVALGSIMVFWYFSMNYGFVLGIATGVAVLIPYVGAFVVAVPVLAVSLYQWGLEPTFFYAMFAYGAVQALDAYVLVPLLFSKSLNLRPVTVLVAITFFAGIWGVWGVFIAIPLATFIKVVLFAWPTAQKEENMLMQKVTSTSKNHTDM